MVAGDVIFEEYTLEYGRDRLEMHVGAVELGERALVVDDLIATGGTLCAAMNLLGNYTCFSIINKLLVKILEEFMFYMGLVTGASIGDLCQVHISVQMSKLCSN